MFELFFNPRAHFFNNFMKEFTWLPSQVHTSGPEYTTGHTNNVTKWHIMLLYLIRYVFDFKFSFGGFERRSIFERTVAKKSVHDTKTQNIRRLGIPLYYDRIVLSVNTSYNYFLSLFSRVAAKY